MKDKEIEKILADTMKVFQIVKKNNMKADKEYIYECPICNGKLHAVKSSYNGHIRIYCEGCKFNLME